MHSGNCLERVKKKSNILIALAIAVLSGCTGNKFLAEGERYYDGPRIKFENGRQVDNKKSLEADLEEILSPKPNGKLLGSRPGVWFYHLAGNPKKEKGFRYWLKYKIGKQPVLIKDVDIEQSTFRLKGFLINHGYFRTEIESTVNQGRHTASIRYDISTGPRYRLRNIVYPKGDSTYRSILAEIQKASLLKEGDAYDLETLKEEQQRIEDLVENRGFYYFDDAYLIFRADSAAGDHKVDLRLRLQEDTPQKARRRYHLGEIKIYPDYSLTGRRDTTRRGDTSHYYGYTFVGDDEYVRPFILANTIVLEQDSLYTQKAESNTLARLMSLGVYKFVNIKFHDLDSATLGANIFLTPLTRKSIRLELQGVSKSNNFLGPSVSATFQNRNAFHGAELFEVKLNSSYEVQVGGQNTKPLTAFETNLETSLTIPRFILPVRVHFRNTQFLPQTRMSLGFRVQERLQVFRLNSFDARYGFQWQETLTKRHELFPVSVSYVNLSNVSADLEQRLSQDPTLSRSLQDQFILGATYDYVFSSRNAANAGKHRNDYYFNGGLELSGNLMRAAEKIVRSEEDTNPGATPYSQYAKAYVDFRYYHKVGRDKQFATRLLVGAAHAYGNSTQVPFIKQFSSGGSAGVRAFRARSLGPGSYRRPGADAPDSTFIIDETGDIKLETSAEYRTKLAGFFDGAIFVDAGNIWLWDGNDDKPGGKFSSNFLSELAVGGGIGLRLNFNVFLIRFDLAMPLRKPWYPKGDRWVFDEINFRSSEWRKENLLLNIAIGYPF